MTLQQQERCAEVLVLALLAFTVALAMLQPFIPQCGPVSDGSIASAAWLTTADRAGWLDAPVPPYSLTLATACQDH